MPRRGATFKQTDWAGKYHLVGDGFCYSLAAEWCRMILADSLEQNFSAPSQSAADRTGAFDTLGMAQSIARDQGIYLAAVAANKPAANMVEAFLLVSQSGFLDAVDNAALLGVAIPLADQTMAVGMDILVRGITARGVRPTSQGMRVTAENCASRLQSKHAYVITLRYSGGGHALGCYVTHGFFSFDYYLFDPNFGEFVANSDADFTDLLRRVLTSYPGATIDLVDVVLG